MAEVKETRLSPRTRIQAQIVFKIPKAAQRGKDSFLTFYSENISEGGVFLKTTSPKIPFSAGTIVDLHFSLPGSPALIRTKGKVIWTTEGWAPNLEGVNGFGIQFTEMKPEFLALIRRFVSENLEK